MITQHWLVLFVQQIFTPYLNILGTILGSEEYCGAQETLILTELTSIEGDLSVSRTIILNSVKCYNENHFWIL